MSDSPQGKVMSSIYQNDTANEFKMLILVVHIEGIGIINQTVAL